MPTPRRAGAERAGPEANGGPQTAAGRPRSEEAHRAILDATLSLLVEVGYSALTVEGIAQRAGVGKATIYRRWPSKLPLVVEAFGDLPAFEEADTGGLASDLDRILRSYVRVYNTTPLGAVVPSLAGELPHNPQLMDLFAPVVKQRRQPLIRALHRAIERGEIPPDTDLDLAADMIVGPMTVRVFFTPGKLSPKIVPAMIALALDGLRRGGAAGSAGS
jgi:AcrR family transcriptional regulator